jgi:hypothetical protein
MIGIKALAQQTHPKAHRAPLTSHPAFTPFLILWFAALLSLSTLAIEGAWLERWVLAMKIDLILPAAAPPLGAKARLLLALGFAVVGAGLGWLAARLLRPAPASDGEDFQLRQRDRHPDAPARRPISAHAELGDEGLGRASSAWDDMSMYRAEPEETRVEAPFAPPPYVSPFQPAATPAFAAAPQAEPAPAPLAHAPLAHAPLAHVPPLPLAATIRDTPALAPVAAVEVPPAHAAPQHEAPHAGEGDADLFELPTIDFSQDATSGQTYAPYPSPADDAGEEKPAEQIHAAPQSDAPQSDAFDDGWHALPPVVSDTDLRPARKVTPPLPSAAILPLAGATPLRAVDSTPPATRLPAVEAPALIGATPVQPRGSAGERIAHASLGDLSHVELIERLAMAIHAREKKAATPVAVNDLQDEAPAAAQQDEEEETPAPQASLRSALASLREVK